MIRSTLRSLLAATICALLLVPAVAIAHEERDSVFPPVDAPTSIPTYREAGDEAARLGVCKDDSADRIAELDDADLRAFNEELLDECAFEHIQAAVDAVEVQATTIYVLPGLYREEPSFEAECARAYDGGVVEYQLIVDCGEVINLITVAGDDPADEDILCDNQLCDLQIEGTGATPQDVRVEGGFDENGDWRKHNGIKADRADGFRLINMAFELFRENAIYVHETSGYLLDRVEANFNQLYGILTFTADRGVISNCETHHNGDSGVYPGSAADVNGEINPLTRRHTVETAPLDRWSVEIFNCNTHHNALGFSGTAGNSVWFHDNLVHNNGAGYVTDSFVPNHPGMPQDHAFLENNRIFANNVNYYVNVQGEDPPCHEEVPADVGFQDGVVCPAFPVPVGTGVLIAGGNSNLVRNNLIYDNWRNGVMQFYVPSVIRYQSGMQDAVESGNMAGLQLSLTEYLQTEGDTSHDNHYIGNVFGQHPDEVVQPNGTDVWWDDQGLGNCWSDNTSTTGDASATVNGVSNNAKGGVLPTCDVPDGSKNPAPDATKSGELLPCSEYHQRDNPDPDNCDWFMTPDQPAGRVAADDDATFAAMGATTPSDRAASVADASAERDAAVADTDAATLAATGGGGLLALLGIGAAVAGARTRRRDAEDDA